MSTQKDISIPYLSSEVQATFKHGNPMVVFSHGFGVERSSFGMFTDITRSLPESYGYILFDYYKIVNDTWYVPGITEMTSKLQAVFNYATTQSPDVVIVSHSQGCTISSLAILDTKHIFLAPPTRKIFSSWKELFVSKRKDRAHIDANGDVELTRKSDGQVLHISTQWFDELVGNTSFDDMIKLAEQGRLVVIEAQGDKDIKDHRGYRTLAKKGATLVTLEGNHNFDPPHRQTMIDEVIQVLSA